MFDDEKKTKCGIIYLYIIVYLFDRNNAYKLW